MTICTPGGAGVPCTPLASIFLDAALTQPAGNPTTTDGLGNLPVVYAAPGVYKFTVTGTGITTQGQPFTATVAGTGGGNVLSGSPNTFTASNTFTQQIISTLATGTAPFSIASTTVVPNLNSQLHNGLTAPASAIVGISDTQTLTNKTLTSPATTNLSDTGTQLTAKRFVASGSAPTCSVTGAGTGATCSAAGTADSAGFMQMTTGTAPSSSGTITLTFTSGYTNFGTCVVNLGNDTLAWNARASIISSSGPGASADGWTWDNNAVALTASTANAYQVNYICIGH